MRRSRRYVVILLGIPAAIWLYSSAVDISRVYDPPRGVYEGPLLQPLIPLTGWPHSFDSQFLLDLRLSATSCTQPVRVFAQAIGPPVGAARNWLRSSAPLTLAVRDDHPVGHMRTFVGALVSPLVYFDESYHGGYSGPARIFPVPTRTVVRRSSLHRRVVASQGTPRRFRSDGYDPVISWEFDADWLSPRAHGSCYLRLPGIDGYAPVVDEPLEPIREVASFTLVRITLDGRSLAVIPGEGVPSATATSEGYVWRCGRGSGSACDGGGYAALSEAAAVGSPDAALIPYLAGLGVVLALVAEALLALLWTSRHGD